MSVLLAFNEADSWTVAKLAEATQIKMDILIQVLNLFCVNLMVLYLIKFAMAIMKSSGSANSAQIKVVGGAQP